MPVGEVGDGLEGGGAGDPVDVPVLSWRIILTTASSDTSPPCYVVVILSVVVM